MGAWHGRRQMQTNCKSKWKQPTTSTVLPKSMNITRLLGDPLPTLSGLPATPPLHSRLPQAFMKDVQLSSQCIQLQPAGSAKLCPRPTFHRSLLPVTPLCFSQPRPLPVRPSGSACSFDTVFYYCAYCCIRFRFEFFGAIAVSRPASRTFQEVDNDG